MPKLVDRAVRYWRTIQAARPSLSAGLLTALDLKVGSGEVGWALALVLAGWRLDAEGDEESRGLLTETGVLPFVRKVQTMAVLLPAPFQQALQVAEGSDQSFAGAATYLAQALRDMGDIEQNALVSWLRGADFREAGWALSRRFPPPDSGLPSTWETQKPAKKALPSRAEKFDRADRPKRKRGAAQNSGVVPPAAAPADPTPEKSSAPPEPTLPPAHVARAHLMSGAGWSAHEAERILSGPEGNAGSALTLRQLLRTYAALAQPERVKFQRMISANEAGFVVSRTDLLPVSIADIRDVRSVDPMEHKTAQDLFGAYQGLPLPERQRMLRWITQQEVTAFSEEDKLPELFATYRRLPKSEQSAFLAAVHGGEKDFPSPDSWRTADVGWARTRSDQMPILSVKTGIAMYEQYRRLDVRARMSLLRAAVESDPSLMATAEVA